MKKDILEMLREVAHAAENGAVIEVIVHADDCECEDECEHCECEKETEESSTDSEETLKAVVDKFKTEMAIATLCMHEAKVLTEKVNFVVEENGEEGLATVNDVLEFCSRHHKVILKANMK